MTSPSRSKRERGFGLLHALFILTTMMIAASVAMMDSRPAERASSVTTTTQRMDQLRDSVARYKADVGAAPPNLNALLRRPAGMLICRADTNPGSPTYRKLKNWCGPYLDWEFTGSDLFQRDGWKVLMQYNGTTLVSCGPNRSCGDGDDLSIGL